MKKSCVKVLLLHGLIFVLLAALLLAMRRLEVTCPIRALTGIPCPTCGMTRSLEALLRLDWRESLRYHPLTLPACAVLWFALHRRLFKLRKRTKDAILIAAAAVIFVVYLLRLGWGSIP